MSDYIWQHSSLDPDNGAHLAAIARWWAALADREAIVAQRLMSRHGGVPELDWSPQRFDERFVVQRPELRGTTLYWRKSQSAYDVRAEERSFSPRKLVLEAGGRYLDIYPFSNAQLVVRVTRLDPPPELPAPAPDRLELANPAIVGKPRGEGCVLLLRGAGDRELLLTLDAEHLRQLRAALPPESPEAEAAH